jgi:hypothetical protein
MKDSLSAESMVQQLWGLSSLSWTTITPTWGGGGNHTDRKTTRSTWFHEPERTSLGGKASYLVWVCCYLFGSQVSCGLSLTSVSKVRLFSVMMCNIFHASDSKSSKT